MAKLRNAIKTAVNHLFPKFNMDGYVASNLFNVQKRGEIIKHEMHNYQKLNLSMRFHHVTVTSVISHF